MRFGLPRDPAQWIALGAAALLALAFLLARAPRPPSALRALADRLRPRSPYLFLAAAALAAALLSAAYVPAYLRGGPRIIDATSYWLEARALAEGHLAWPIAEPLASTLGRFLVHSDAGAGPRAAVLFPPGYPAALALGFLAGAPLAVGPLLAAALVVATWALAAQVSDPAPPGRLPLVPALAAALSVLCAALRYHTADTMSHGLAALCFTAALSAALRALAAPTAPWPFAALSGIAAGWLAAARPFSALALGATLLVLLARPGPGASPPARRLRVAALIALGALPGLALLLAHQRAATGAWASSQAAYYAASDGPPGCFRYGFGAGIGCLGEHGDFVHKNLAEGYGALAAAGTTLRRLKLHLVDPLNAEPLFLLVLAGAAAALRHPRARLLVLAPLFQIAAYAPFYFDGNYPGGGARFYADVLPLEHVLAALALAAWARRPRGSPARAAALAAALPLLGFAFRAGFDHALLRDREGGLPMFDPAVVARAGVTRGLVLVDTDHGFNLGHDPASASPVQVLRRRGDALDRMAWEARGHPPLYLYRFDIPADGGLAAPSLAPLSLPPDELQNDELQRIEGESLWPPRSQRGAWALPEHAGGTCASAGRWLALYTAPDGAIGSPAEVRLGLPAPWLRGRLVAPRVAAAGGASGVLRLLVDGVEVHAWPIAPPGSPPSSLSPGDPPGPPGWTCAWLDPHPVPAGAGRVELALVAPHATPASLAPAPRFALDVLGLPEGVQRGAPSGKAVDR